MKQLFSLSATFAGSLGRVFLVFIGSWLLLAQLVATAQPTGAPLPNTPYWEWQNPLPTGYDLLAAHVFNDSTAVVVGAHGTALKTRNYGRTWQTLNVGTTDRLTHVSFANELVGWVAVLTPPTDQYPITRPYAGIGEVRRTTDGGLTWTRQQIDNSGTQIRTLKAISPTEAYVGYEELICTNPNLSCGGYATPRLRRTTNGGQSWTLVNTAYPLLQFVTPGVGIAWRAVQGNSTMLLRTRDGGQTFRDITPVLEQDRYYGPAVFTDSLHGWVTSGTFYNHYPPNLYRTQDGGRTWTAQHARADFLNPERPARGLAFADSLHGVAILDGGAALVTADGGRTWQEARDAATNSTGLVVNSTETIWANPGGHGYWSVGAAGRVTASADDGRTWTSYLRDLTAGNDPGGTQLKQVTMLDATHGWAWGPRRLLRTADRGVSWDVFRTDSISGMPLTYGYLRAASFTDRDTGCVVIQSGVYDANRSWLQASIVRTTDGGRHWTPQLQLPYVPRQPYNLNTNLGGLQALRFGTAQRAVLVGDSGTIFATQDGGRTWSRRPSPTRRRLTDVAWAGPAGRTVYVSGDSATLCRSDDGGLSWRAVRIDSASFMITVGQFYPAAMRPEQPVRGIVFTSPEVGYMTDADQGVYKTTNGGRTWANTTNLRWFSTLRGLNSRAAYSLNLHFRTPQEGWYFGDDSFRTTDAGHTWTKLPVVLGDALGSPMAGGGGVLADSYNAWLVGTGGRILHYSEKFIQAAPTTQTTYAPGQTLTLAFAATNVTSTDFRVQLSNRAGRFRAGEVLEVGRGTTSPLPVTLPASLPAGTAYRLRVVLGDSSVLGADNGQDLDIAPVPLPDLVVSTTQTVAGGAYNNVTVTGTGRLFLTADLSVAGAMVVQAGGVVQAGVGSSSAPCSTISGPGSFALADGATLFICSPDGLSASGTTGGVQVSGARTFSSRATYYYNASTAQVTGAGLPSEVRNLGGGFNGGPLTLTQPLAVREVVLVDNADLLTNDRLLTLLSDSVGTGLIYNRGTGLVVGTATVQRHIAGPNRGLGYRHYSSPVSGNALADLATPGFAPVLTAAYNTAAVPGLVTPFPTVFGYDQSRLATASNNFSPFDKGWVVPTALTAGQGYAVNIAGTEKVDFTGTPRTGDLPLTLARNAGPTAAEAGWHLVGNPYPAPLDWRLVQNGADRQNLDAAMYVFESSSQYAGQYRSYTNGLGGGDPLIASSQGFFVRVSSGQTSGALTFRNAHRLTTFGATTFRRTTTDLRPQLQLTLAGATGPADELVVYFEAGATPAADGEFDAVKLANPSGLNLAALAATGQPLAIDGRPLLGAQPVLVPLSVDVPAAGAYVLTVAELRNLAAGMTLWLRDNARGTLTPLAPGTQYAFTLGGFGAPGRFALEFRPGTATANAAQALAAQVQLAPNPTHGSLTLTLPVGARATTVQVLNALGQLVRTYASAPATLDLSGLPAGVYAVRVQLAGELVTKRVVLQ
jgi:photosystem II stability/assembly factor-like uncharacterized protein